MWTMFFTTNEFIIYFMKLDGNLNESNRIEYPLTLPKCQIITNIFLNRLAEVENKEFLSILTMLDINYPWSYFFLWLNVISFKKVSRTNWFNETVMINAFNYYKMHHWKTHKSNNILHETASDAFNVKKHFSLGPD